VILYMLTAKGGNFEKEKNRFVNRLLCPGKGGGEEKLIYLWKKGEKKDRRCFTLPKLRERRVAIGIWEEREEKKGTKISLTAPGRGKFRPVKKLFYGRLRLAKGSNSMNRCGVGGGGGGSFVKEGKVRLGNHSRHNR